jgi:hypothetical protein
MLAKSERMMATAASMMFSIERGRVRLVNQLRAELLQQLGVGQLGFELRPTSAAMRLRLAGVSWFRCRRRTCRRSRRFRRAPGIREGEPGLLVIALAIHHERQVFAIVRLAGQRGIDQRADVGPDFRPDIGKARPQCARVLAPRISA